MEILIRKVSLRMISFYMLKTVNILPVPQIKLKRYHDCYGTYNFSSGNKYVGEFKNDFRNTVRGFLPMQMEIKYVGEYKDDMRNGQGTYTYAGQILRWAGDKYVGEYKDGLRCTVRGLIPMPDGSQGSWYGAWENDKLKRTRYYLLRRWQY